MSINIETLERATLDAVAPQVLEEIPGWVVPMDASSIGRATSAVPLVHDGLRPTDVPLIEARYAARNFAAQFRIADSPGLSVICRELHWRGYNAARPTLTRLCAVHHLQDSAKADTVVVTDAPTEAWKSVYTAEGFDPVDGAERIAALSRSPVVIYACLSDETGALAAGTASLSRDWMGIHGIRTLPRARGRGLAAQIIAALAGRAASLGLERAFLQVEEDNAAANALYDRLRFTTAWRYRYWNK